jgi:hypothetical protein
MRIGSVVGLAWRYVTGTWVLPGAALVIAALAVRDAIVPEVPLWVGFIEFPLFLCAVFGPFVDAARREDRWHLGRGWIWSANEPRLRGWWSSQFGFLVVQLKRPAWWAPTLFKMAILLTVARLAPETVRYVALLPIAIAIAAVTSIPATGWRLQERWDRVVPGGDLPPWMQRRVDRWPLTAAVVGLIVAGANAAMAVYFFSVDRWPLELVCTVQCFWLGVTSLRRLAPAAPWRQSQVATAPVVRPGRAA